MLQLQVQAEYSDFVGNLIDQNKAEGVTLLVGETDRNPLYSDTPELFIRLMLLRRYLENRILSFHLIVNSKELRQIAKQLLRQYAASADIEVLENRRRPKFFCRLTRTLYNSLNSYVWPRLLRGKYIPKIGEILVDIMISAESFHSQSRVEDSQYPGLLQAVGRVQRNHTVTFFVSAILGLRSLRSYRNFWLAVRKHEQPIILKEDWLKLGDYVWAITHSYTEPLKIKKVPMWRGLDLTSLIKAKSRCYLGDSGLVSSLLLYRFWFRLRKSGFSPAGVVDWNENQILDRALCLGVRRNYPHVWIKGYQGFFLSDYHDNFNLTKYERRAGITPHEILVVSSKLVSERQKYEKHQIVSAAPAFRFSRSNRDQTHVQPVDRTKILVGLPILRDVVNEILRLCSELPEAMKKELVIRPHPYFDQKTLSNLLLHHQFNEPVIDSKTAVYDQLGQASMLVSVGSTLCVEAVAAGVGVAIVASTSGPTLNPLNSRFPQQLWRICYSSKDLQEFGEEMQSNDFLGYRQDVFCPVTDSAVAAMLEFPGSA